MLELKNLILYAVLVVVTYFFMEVLTDKNKKLSIVGTILVCCSSFIFYKGIPMAIIFGQLAIVSLDKVFACKNKYLKILFVVILLITLWLYGATYSYGYYVNYIINGFTRVIHITYLALAIWLVIKNTEGLSRGKRIVVCFFPIIISVEFILYTENFYVWLDNSVLDLDNEKNGFTHLFSYGYSMFLPFVDTGKNAVYASFLSVFPLSLILAMIYVYKKEKHLDFFMPMILAIIIESIYCMTKVPILEIFGFESDMYYDFFAGAIGLSCIYLYIYMFANIEENIFKQADSAKVALAVLVFYFLVPRPEAFMTRGYMYGLAAVLTLLYFMFINFADKRYQKVLLVVLVLWSLISTIPVLF